MTWNNRPANPGFGDFTSRKTFEQLDLPCYPSQVRNMADIYGSGQEWLSIATPAGELYACGTASYHVFNEDGEPPVALLTHVNVM